MIAKKKEKKRKVRKSSTATDRFSDDRHGLTRDLNSNTVWDISDLCLTPSGVKTTRPTPLINVMFSLILSLSLSPMPSLHSARSDY